MLISCKCLNFIASSSLPSYKSANNAAVETADAPPAHSTATTEATNDNDGKMSSTILSTSTSTGSLLSAALLRAFLQKYPRNFIFYSQCMEFFKQLIGPISDLTLNAVNQRDLIYSLTLDTPQGQSLHSWQISICINCNSVLCAKRLHSGTPQFLVNGLLVTSNEELMHRRSDKSYSDTFGILIMDHPQASLIAQNGSGVNGGAPSSSVSFTVGSVSSATLSIAVDPRQQRLRQLQHHMQQRLKREIAETDERIQRYTEQQFALLKSFREKAEQEYEMLTRLLQRVPERQAIEWLDRIPPALEVNGVANFSGRRRNTIGSRRDLNMLPTTPAPVATITPTAIHPPVINFSAIATPTPTPPATAITKPTPITSAIDGNTQDTAVNAARNTVVTANGSSNNAAGTRRVSNFDTPPATPEAMPMSIGNSPTFKQQQQQQQQQQQHPPSLGRLSNSQSFQQQFPTPTAELEDDCFFELEGIDGGASAMASFSSSNHNYHPHQHHSLAAQQTHPYHRSLSLGSHHSNNNNHMSDLDESDGAEEAEDALNMEDCSIAIPMHQDPGKMASQHLMNFGKSLPIEIANSPMADRTFMGEPDDDDLDNNVDIAASIKALAKSVHGEAVFGDLPRPRLRSQI